MHLRQWRVRTGADGVLLFFGIAIEVALSGCASVSSNRNSQLASSSAIPVITSPTTAYITAGTPFTYQVTATGGPSSFGAQGLPLGLTIDPVTGAVQGRAFISNTTSVELHATNALGTGMANLSLVPANAPDSVGSGDGCDTDTNPPSAAKADGFTSLVFCDDFDSDSTVDLAGTSKPGYKWYVHSPGNDLPRSAVSIANSVLTIWDTSYHFSEGISSQDRISGNGRTFKFGYFEARIDFDPSLGPLDQGWPAFWALSARHVNAHLALKDPTPWAELDFFEALPNKTSPGIYTGTFAGTIHQWQYDGPGDSGPNLTDFVNSNNKVSTNVNWTQWHIVACLWTMGKVTWYLDGVPLITQRYSSDTYGDLPGLRDRGTDPIPLGVFTLTDHEDEGMQLILGSGPKWPMNVDWVRVWQ